MTWKTYPAYKDSGFEWLTDIPKGWMVLPFKRLGRFQAGAGFPDEQQGMQDEDLPFYKVSDMNLEGNEIFMNSHNNSVSRETAVKLRAFVFPPETIIFAKVGAALLLNKRRILTKPSCVDNNTMGFIRNSCNLKWIYYWMCGLDLARLANPGAVPSVNEGQMRNIPVPFPPENEQCAISAFLDKETERIDSLIAKKERQIELLQEKRAALISQAVTKGLNPNAKMKDSGYPWIGKIPDQWKVKQFKRLTTRIDVGIAEAATHAYSDQGVPIIRSTNVRANRILTKDLLHIEPWFAEKNRSKYLYANDLVTVRTGAPGTTAVVPKELDGCQCFTMLISTLKQGQIPEFYSYFLNASSAKFRFAVEGWGTAQINISVPILQEQIIVEPPESEQRAIVEYIRTVGDRLDVLAEKVTASVTKLREYKAALISAAVAGKIDVREEDS